VSFLLHQATKPDSCSCHNIRLRAADLPLCSDGDTEPEFSRPASSPGGFFLLSIHGPGHRKNENGSDDHNEAHSNNCHPRCTHVCAIRSALVHEAHIFRIQLAQKQSSPGRISLALAGAALRACRRCSSSGGPTLRPAAAFISNALRTVLLRPQVTATR